MAQFPNKIAEIRKTIANLFSGAKIEPGEDAHVAFYKMLGAYYKMNGLYDDIMSASFYLDVWHESMKPLRNPANRSVEFFVNKVMPGVLPDSAPLVADNTRILEPIQRIHTWSNLNANKSKAIRWLSIYGDLWVRPNPTEDNKRVYLKFMKPHHMTDWSVDDRGFITSLRIDVPIKGGHTHTEWWTPEMYNIWEHHFGRDKPLMELGQPMMEGFMSDFGIDFVPFVHIMFRDIGDKRGWGAYTHVLDKIDEANRMATRLHDMLFRYNKAFWAVSANASTPEGAPLPPPKVRSTSSTGVRSTKEDGTADMSDQDMFRLPGQSTIESLVPDVKYGDALQVLQDHMAEIEKDLPELAFYELKDLGLSGIALTTVLGGAVARAEEARANWEAGLIRAENMALSIGQFYGMFPNIGSFDAGDYEHQYTPRDIFPMNVKDKAEAMAALVKAGVDPASAAKLAGFDPGELNLNDESTINAVVNEFLRAQKEKVTPPAENVAEAIAGATQ